MCGELGHDLTRRHGDEPIGERITVSGRVFDTEGKPLRGTLVEIWQANPGLSVGVTMTTPGGRCTRSAITLARSAITLALLTALGREHEIPLHVRAAVRNGPAPEEIGEVLPPRFPAAATGDACTSPPGWSQTECRTPWAGDTPTRSPEAKIAAPHLGRYLHRLWAEGPRWLAGEPAWEDVSARLSG